jgi:PAS domain S-box-containing protein
LAGGESSEARAARALQRARSIFRDLMTGPVAPPTEEPAVWRERVLRWYMIISLVLVAPTIVVWGPRRHDPDSVLILACIPVYVLLLFGRRRLSFATRVGLALVIQAAIALFGMALVGWVAGRVILLQVAVMTSVLLGARLGLFVVVTITASLALIVWGWRSGVIPPPRGQDPFAIAPNLTLTFLTQGSLVTLAVGFLLARLQGSLTRTRGLVVDLQGAVTSLTTTNATLRRRDQLLEAFAAISAVLLDTRRWRDAAPAILGRLRRETSARRAFFAALARRADGPPILRIVASDLAPGAAAPRFDLDEPIDLETLGLAGRVASSLADLRPIVIRRDDVAPPMQQVLQDTGTEALVYVPITHDQLWGYLVLVEPDSIDQPLLDGLAALGGAMGSAIAREEVEGRMASIMSVVPVGVAEVRDGRIVFANEALAQLAGRPGQDLLERPLTDLLAIDQAPVSLDATLAREPQGRADPAEVVLRDAGGQRHDVVVRSAPLRIGEQDSQTISIVDVTERLRLERQLRQVQKMDALGQLASGVAHDFNNLLAIIGLNHSAIRSRLGAGKDVSSQLQVVEEAVGQAASIVRQLLGFARQQPLVPRPLDLGESLGRTVPMVAGFLGRSIKTSLEVAPDLPRISADPTMIEQVVMNLLINARDAIDARGEGPRTILVRAWREEATPARVLMSVADTGGGMDEGTRSRIFEPFFTTKPEGKGTGLGLATVYGAVLQLGGSIDVTSEVGVGSTFRIAWPVAAVDEASAATGG